MKSALSLTLLLLGTLPLLSEEAPPAVPITKVVQLAQEALAAKSAPKSVYIRSIVLTRPSLMGSLPHWEVAWSSPLPATLPGSKEIGLEISMAGEVVHLVKGKAAK